MQALRNLKIGLADEYFDRAFEINPERWEVAFFSKEGRRVHGSFEAGLLMFKSQLSKEKVDKKLAESFEKFKNRKELSNFYRGSNNWKWMFSCWDNILYEIILKVFPEKYDFIRENILCKASSTSVMNIRVQSFRYGMVNSTRR